MRCLLTILCLFLLSRVFCQPCSCIQDYHFIKKHIETNHGGFNKKIKSPEEPAYKAFIQQLESEISPLKDPKYCLLYLKKYIRYLQDHHSNITGPSGNIVAENDSAALAAFFNSPAFLQTETLSPDSNYLAQLRKNDSFQSPEGIYYSTDSTYMVALIKSKTSYRDYAAVILQSKTRLWKPGQVKFELKQVNDSLFDVLIALRNHSWNAETALIKNGILQLNNWKKAGLQVAVNPSIFSGPSLFSFKILDDKTTLITIRSFDAGLTNKLDSFYQRILPEIKKFPHLIIDIRDNGGGSDASYKKLMPLIYTNPFDDDVMEYFATPDNIAAYKQYDSLLLLRNPGATAPFRYPIALMKKAPAFSFIGFGNGKPQKVQYSMNKGNPEKIAVVYNRNCASSCESFLFEVLQSKKSIMVGENSGGYTGYGNVMTITTPCGNNLSWTTTVYREQWKYEFKGIPPRFPVPAGETDWIGYTKKLMEE